VIPCDERPWAQAIIVVFGMGVAAGAGRQTAGCGMDATLI